MELRPFTPELPGFDKLLGLSLDEGHRMLLRLAENWENGSNRFTRPGELINAAFDGEVMVGVGGRNIDPYVDDERVARVRHMFVHPSHRRHGVGRLLMGPIMSDPEARFDIINCRAPPEAFSFYESFGFLPVFGDEKVTHRLNLYFDRSGAL